MIDAACRKRTHLGPSADAVSERGAKRPASHLLRLLQCLAVAIVTLVCALVASPSGKRAASVEGATVEVTAAKAAHALRRASAPRRSHHLRDGAAHRVLDLEAAESQIDDGDALYDVADREAVGDKAVSSAREPGRALRCQPPIDTSRFARGSGLPRGPPT